MMKEIAIKVENLSKVYRLYDKPVDRLKESIHPMRKKYHKDFYALKDVSLEVKKGETVGIIGKNGSGKSTLLKIITGVLTQTSGNVTVNGRVSALLELGAGFNPEFTGVENIYLNGTLMGYSKEEIDAKVQAILDFADIGDFVNQPVKMYSSGMFARLAFAVAINVDPDILIVDEALSVGDAFFIAKCMARIKEFVESENKTVLFVSHSLEIIRSFCNRCILLDRASIHIEGDVKTVTETYERLINKSMIISSREKSILELVVNEKLPSNNLVIEKNSACSEDVEFIKRVSNFRVGSGEARFIRAEILVDGEVSNIIKFGETAVFRILIEYYSDVNTQGTVGYMIRNQNGQDIFGMNTYCLNERIPPMKKGQRVEVRFGFKNVLSSGKYSVSLGLKDKPFEQYFIDGVHVAIVFEVPLLEDENYVPGLMYVPNSVQIIKLNLKNNVRCDDYGKNQ